jgi:hypothetical protein
MPVADATKEQLQTKKMAFEGKFFNAQMTKCTPNFS